MNFVARQFLILNLGLAFGACDSSSQTRKPDTAEPPIALNDIDRAIERTCKIDVREWHRTYFFRWLPNEKRFSDTQLGLLLERGPYADLQPSRSWRDPLEVAQIDDRDGILSYLGYYDLRTKAVMFEDDHCPPKQSESATMLPELR